MGGLAERSAADVLLPTQQGHWFEFCSGDPGVYVRPHCLEEFTEVTQLSIGLLFRFAVFCVLSEVVFFMLQQIR